MDYYNILGVDITATQEEIKKQYKKKAIVLHPDKGGCEEKFKELTEAYSVLSDEKKRHEYDMFGKNGPLPNMFPNDPFFNLFFNHQNDTNFMHQNMSQRNIKKDNNVEITLELSFEEIYAGIIKSFSFHRNENCNKCINNSIKKCDICNGSGFIIQIQSIGPFTQRIRTTCDNCLGKGKKIAKNNACIICHGNNTISMKKNMQIKIQKGISINNKIVIQNEGHQDIENGNGNLLINIKEIPHKVFIRDKYNLLLKMNITLYDILLKIKIEIKHLDNRKLYIEANSEEIRCIINEGMCCLTENQEKSEHYRKLVGYFSRGQRKIITGLATEKLEKYIKDICKHGSSVGGYDAHLYDITYNVTHANWLDEIDSDYVFVPLNYLPSLNGFNSYQIYLVEGSDEDAMSYSHKINRIRANSIDLSLLEDLANQITIANSWISQQPNIDLIRI